MKSTPSLPKSVGGFNPPVPKSMGSIQAIDLIPLDWAKSLKKSTIALLMRSLPPELDCRPAFFDEAVFLTLPAEVFAEDVFKFVFLNSEYDSQ